MLSVIPDRCDRVAVEIPKYQSHALAVIVAVAIAGTGMGGKGIHQAFVERRLFVAIIMVLVACRGLRAAEPKGIDRARPVGGIACVRIVGQQDAFGLVIYHCAEPVDCRRVVAGAKTWFAFGIERYRVGREIMVE